MRACAPKRGGLAGICDRWRMLSRRGVMRGLARGTRGAVVSLSPAARGPEAGPRDKDAAAPRVRCDSGGAAPAGKVSTARGGSVAKGPPRMKAALIGAGQI